MPTVAIRLKQVRARIAQAEKDAQRVPGSVGLVAVSKRKTEQNIRDALALGQICFGESYVQEALTKIHQLRGQPIEWHFIGAIQSNKAKEIAQHFSWVHSIDRLATAERLNAARPAERGPLNICIQVNISAEPTKAGVDMADLPALANAIAQLSRLRLRGLMAIPLPTNDITEQRRVFSAVRKAKEQLQSQGLTLDTLSMGMSADLEAAIAEGATLVRVGTDIFGSR